MKKNLLIGMVHLPPMPGGPAASKGFAELRRQAMADAHAIVDTGMEALIIENFGDAPFPAGACAPHVVAAIAIFAAELRALYPQLIIGLNLLRNDAYGAMGAAAAAGADFIRVNVHTGAMLTDQGILEGKAWDTLCYRKNLESNVAIAADVLVKHAAPLTSMDIGAMAADTFYRGRAEVLIVTGQGTGHGADPSRALAIRRAVPEAPLWVGSGVDPKTAAFWRSSVDGAIVGTYLHEEGRIQRPIDPHRVEQLLKAWSQS